MAVSNRSSAPVPVFASCGVDGWGPVQDLRARSEIELVSTPRHASVLLVAGPIASDHHEALDRVHDQVPHPRTSVAWACGGAPPSGPWTPHETDLDGLVQVLIDAHLHVVSDPASSEPDRLPDVVPNEWRGVGPFGQGGEGMMGGVPYGRPMAMTGDDRDGLALDQLHLRLGPFLDALPPGLVLDVTLQGEVLQHAELHRSGAEGPTDSDPSAPPGHRSTLRQLSWALHLAGLDGLAAQAARLSVGLTESGQTDNADLARLRRRIRRRGWLWTLRGVGALDGRDAADRWRSRLDSLTTPDLGGPADLRCALDDLGRALAGATLTDAVAAIASVRLAHGHAAVVAP